MFRNDLSTKERTVAQEQRLAFRTDFFFDPECIHGGNLILACPLKSTSAFFRRCALSGVCACSPARCLGHSASSSGSAHPSRPPPADVQRQAVTESASGSSLPTDLSGFAGTFHVALFLETFSCHYFC